MNPFYNRIGNQGQFQSGGMPGPFSNFSNMLNQFRNFKSQFQGDPQQQVQQLLNSGQMTQEQFNQLSQLAQQFQNSMK